MQELETTEQNPHDLERERARQRERKGEVVEGGAQSPSPSAGRWEGKSPPSLADAFP